MRTKNILLVGVGGQGSLLASRILGHVFLSMGYDVKISEVHGMAQRGGSVVTYIRYGKHVVASPIVDNGTADLIVSFEELEALRYLPCISSDGLMVTNTQHIAPMPVLTGASKYPNAIAEEIRSKGVRLITADGLTIARESGSVKCVNVAILGIAAAFIEADKALFLKAIDTLVPEKLLHINKVAFEKGYCLGASSI